jgi:hypothetical protein
MGGAVELRLTGEAQAQLTGIGLAKDDQSGALQPFDLLAVLCRHGVGEKLAGARGRYSREGRREIFYEKWYAGQRPIRQAGRNDLAAIVVELHDHGVDAGITGFHPHDGGVEQFIGGDLATPHQVSQSQRIVVFVFGEFTHACHSHVRTPLTEMV